MRKKSIWVLRLEGPLQSWGQWGKWDRREGAHLPTRSGIVGLLGCALGMDREDPGLLELSHAFVMAVRADRPGMPLWDYQIVTGSPLLNARGEKRVGWPQIVTRREYLQDASFTVFLKMERDWGERVAGALQAPVWPLCLGRKCCVPSCPLLAVEESRASSLEEALRTYPVAERAHGPFLYETEEESENLSLITRPDEVVDPSRRVFTLRRVWRGRVREEKDVLVEAGIVDEKSLLSPGHGCPKASSAADGVV